MDDRGSVPPPLGPTPSHPPRSKVRRWVAVAMVIAGTIWTLQGLGILTAGRSFMIGDPTWVAIGAAFVVIGAVVSVRERR